VKSEINRRRFVKSAGASGSFLVVPRHVLGGANYVPPSDKLTLAHIGMGTQGFRELGRLLEAPEIQVVAVCDPNTASNDYVEWGRGGVRKRIQEMLRNPSWRESEGGCPGGREIGREVVDTYYANVRGAERFKGCAAYADYRELLEKEKDVDALKVMTPDRLHACITIAAARKGKHVVMHKPIANRLHEARMAIDAVRENKVQSHLLAFGSGAANGLICAKIKQGAIGRLREIHNWTNRPVWPQYAEIPRDRPPVPDGFDWSLWLGPALYRPYHPHYTHTVFRGWYDFGGGSMADMGIYALWPVFEELGLEAPVSADAWATHTCAIVDLVSRPMPNDFSYPAACRLRFEFAASGDRPGLELFWYDGGMKPRLPKRIQDDIEAISREGILFVGDEGSILAGFHGRNPRIYTKNGVEPLWAPGSQEAANGSPKDRTQVWIDAFRNGEPSPGSFLRTGPISDTVNLGTVALRAGKKVLFDSATMKITNDSDANRHLVREYRPGWEI